MDELNTDEGAPLSFDLSEDGEGSPLLKLSGELDMSNADQLDDAVAPALSRSPARLIVDTSELRFGDSSAIALFVKWSSVVDEIELRDPPELLRHVIARMGLSERLRVQS